MRFWLLVMLLFQGWFYNSYFGWNAWPKNDAEMICDMLFGIMAVLVYVNTLSKGGQS